MGESRDDVIQQAGASNSRIIDGAAVFGSVAAVDASSGQVNADVASFERSSPIAWRQAIPGEDMPGG